MTREEVGAMLREARHQKNLTVRETAELAGIDRSTLSRAERKGDVTLLTLFKVGDVLGVKVVLEPES